MDASQLTKLLIVPNNENLFSFLPIVLRSILQITPTTAFHQTLQLLSALRLLSQVLSLLPCLTGPAGEAIAPGTPCSRRGNSLPPQAQNTISEQTERNGRDRRPREGTVTYTQTSLKN